MRAAGRGAATRAGRRRTAWLVGATALALPALSACGVTGDLLGVDVAAAGPTPSARPGAVAAYRYPENPVPPRTTGPVRGGPVPPSTTLALPSPPVGATRSVPVDRCGTWMHRGWPDVPLTVVPGRGSLTVRWWYDGNPDVRAYEAAAVTLEAAAARSAGATGGAPVVRWQRVGAPWRGGSACTPREMSVTLTGLTGGRRHTVWLQVEYANHTGPYKTVLRLKGNAGGTPS